MAIRLVPGRADLLFQLGCFHASAGDSVSAAQNFHAAAQMRPNYVDALFRLGAIFAAASVAGHGNKDAERYAADWFRKALAIDPNLPLANLFVMKDLERHGRLADAREFRNRIPRPLALQVCRAPRQERTVLLVCTPSEANTPFRNLIDQGTNSIIEWYVEFADAQQTNSLPAFDVVFNAIGNADLDEYSFEPICDFARALHVPLLNHPDRIRQTRRDRMETLFAGIPDLVIPRTVRLSRQEVIGPDLLTGLQARGISFPFIVRPFGQQGGVGTVLVSQPSELAAALAEDVDFYYFIEFVDYRSADGNYRKYRTIFVDRHPYSYHAAISSNWLVHYFSADMLADAVKRDEERRFLEDARAALGQKAADALAAICHRMDIDYAGIDYSVLPDGRLVVFEANATMSVYEPTEDEYAYKRPIVVGILAALQAMLAKAAGAS